eukprot:31197-Pelagococcus_subviridis.AAC.22
MARRDDGRRARSPWTRERARARRVSERGTTMSRRGARGVTATARRSRSPSWVYPQPIKVQSAEKVRDADERQKREARGTPLAWTRARTRGDAPNPSADARLRDGARAGGEGRRRCRASPPRPSASVGHPLGNVVTAIALSARVVLLFRGRARSRRPRRRRTPRATGATTRSRRRSRTRAESTARPRGGITRTRSRSRTTGKTTSDSSTNPETRRRCRARSRRR